jgi:hypothetical protein
MLQSASSYECDGCSHHASFHSMENKNEDEIRKRWEQEAKDKADQGSEAQQRPKKRVRAIEYQSAMGTNDLLGMGSSSTASTNTSKGRGAVAKKPGRVAAAKARAKVTDIVYDDDEDDTVIELID